MSECKFPLLAMFESSGKYYILWNAWVTIMTYKTRYVHWCNSCMTLMQITNFFIRFEAYSTGVNFIPDIVILDMSPWQEKL